MCKQQSSAQTLICRGRRSSLLLVLWLAMDCAAVGPHGNEVGCERIHYHTLSAGLFAAGTDSAWGALLSDRLATEKTVQTLTPDQSCWTPGDGPLLISGRGGKLENSETRGCCDFIFYSWRCKVTRFRLYNTDPPNQTQQSTTCFLTCRRVS